MEEREQSKSGELDMAALLQKLLRAFRFLQVMDLDIREMDRAAVGKRPKPIQNLFDFHLAAYEELYSAIKMIDAEEPV